MYRLITLLVVLVCSPAFAVTHYVDLNSPSPTPPYTNWGTAATNIQDAVDVAGSGDKVLVADGHYYINSEIVVSNDIRIESMNGPEVTIIDANRSSRCLNLGSNACVVSGFTIQNGLDDSCPYEVGCGGGGIRCESDLPMVTNCIFRNNDSGERGFGGGMYNGTANNCIFIDNGAMNGGGMNYGTANNCIFIDNVGDYGAGMREGTANNCTFIGNCGDFASGIEKGTANNCAFIGNSGPAMKYGDAFNCIFVNNTNYYVGGGMVGGTAYNCTFIGNSSSWGGGMYQGNAFNCIFWNNTAETAGNDFFELDECKHSCSTQLIHGVDGNITNAPMFVDPENGDYRLLATSPCIDAGFNGLVTTLVDFDGNPRIFDGDFDGTATVDMGAYEFNVLMIPADCIIVPSINVKSKGRTPVTILSTDDFDATTIDPSTVRFAGASPVHHSMKGRDLKLHFLTADLNIDPADTEAMLFGQTRDGELLVGICPVRIVHSK